MVKTRKLKLRKTLVKDKKKISNKSKKNLRKTRKLKGGEKRKLDEFGNDIKQELVDKLTHMLDNNDNKTIANNFIDEIIDKLCNNNLHGSPGSPSSPDIKTPSEGEDGTELDTYGKEQAKALAREARETKKQKKLLF